MAGREPFDPASAPELADGIRQFNGGHHWHAHEAWEHLWLRLDGDDKRFVQGLIMAAAMLVQYGKGVHRGVRNHWNNVQDRLPDHAPKKWGIDITGLMEQLAPFAQDASQDRSGRDTSHVKIRFIDDRRA